MKHGQFSKRALLASLVGIAAVACGGGTTSTENGSGGVTAGGSGSGGSGGSGGASTSGGRGGQAGGGAGGMAGSGGQAGGAGSGSGGSVAGGSTSTGGRNTTGGATNSGGTAGAGGVAGSGGGGTGGRADGGVDAPGGRDAARPDLPGSTGGRATGGAAGGGATGSGGVGTGGTTSTGTSTIDCNATMPTGGVDHCGQNTQGNAAGLAWSLWSNSVSPSACITTFSTPAFSARWSDNNDFLARVGLEFGNAGKPYAQYGTIKADFAYTKSGTAGGFSYIGIYGWTTNPCVEWYIVDDRWGTMPFNAYNATLKGTVPIDGADYKLFSNSTTGTGGSRCSGVSSWQQYWSIRQKARQCGTITVSDHLKAWEDAGLALGGLLEAKILVETGGGTGSIDFPVANVTQSQ